MNGIKVDQNGAGGRVGAAGFSGGGKSPVNFPSPVVIAVVANPFSPLLRTLECRDKLEAVTELEAADGIRPCTCVVVGPTTGDVSVEMAAVGVPLEAVVRILEAAVETDPIRSAS